MQTLEQARASLETVRTLLGRKLVRVRNARYLFNGAPEPEAIGEVEFTCEGGKAVTLSLASDGESVMAASRALQVPEGFDISDDARCDWRAEDLLATLDARHLIGRQVIGVEGLRVVYQQHEACLLEGFRITLEGGDYLVFFNCGDEEAVRLNQPPPPLSEASEQWVTEL
ncbi:hypothetical protein [Metapseudomonas otitidis]|uniref:hypothetical protein n=1 Tax=Metapseudomonas otitidis TaxID=319939 RepID=UPI00280A80CD|nr:hypothetical protein [Pseudomonas otitidis]